MLPSSRLLFLELYAIIVIDMQHNPRKLSQLRQKLIQLYQTQGTKDDLVLFLSNYPLIKGTVYPLRRKCSKPYCRCARGALHETIVLTASVGGKTRLWTIPTEHVFEIRRKVENYRRYRRARAIFVKKLVERQRAMVQVINGIEKLRTHPL